MENYLKEFLTFFDQENKEECVKWALGKMEDKTFSIEYLYEEILKEALYTIDNCREDSHDCIWKEHIKTAIIRTIVECCYPYVVEAAGKVTKNGEKVLIVCPEKELHEVAPRMAADIFVLNGYQGIFVGSNTPRLQALAAVKLEKPDYLVISVTDYYTVSEAKKMIDLIKSETNHLKIILAGRGFARNPEVFNDLGVDGYLGSFRDIGELKKEGLGNATSV